MIVTSNYTEKTEVIAMPYFDKNEKEKAEIWKQPINMKKRPKITQINTIRSLVNDE